MSLLVGLLRRRLSETTIQHWLGDGRPRGYLLAAGLGAITPFCSCSTIPMLKGLIDARAGFGPMMVFLFTSPLLNPIIVVLLAVTFGWSLTGIYFMAALLFSLVAGWLLQRLGFRREIRAETTTVGGECRAGTAGGVVVAPPSCGGVSETSGSQACTLELTTPEAAVTGRDGRARGKPDLRGIRQETWADFRARAALPHPRRGHRQFDLWLRAVRSAGAVRRGAKPWSVPVAAVIGIPLYLRAEALIPIAGALMEKASPPASCWPSSLAAPARA
ncbi:MAG: permease [Chromatiales bacterium]|nr:permease [Chromatiales bacterium]MCK7582214.1 permease [Chromatiales bacterium]